MAPALIITLALLSAALALWGLTMRASLRSATRQMRALTEASHRVHLAAPNWAAEELIASVNDILERRQTDRSQYLQWEASLRRQIANISHDLRTPLTSMLGYLQLLQDDALPPEKRREYLAIVNNRAKALQSLITGFYDLSRLESDGYPLTQVSVPLAPILSELLAACYEDLEAGGFAVTVDLGEGLPAVLGDPAAIERIFTNLLRNVLEHGEGALSLRLYCEGGNVISVVENNAPYLTAEDAAQVFDRFFTSDKMRTGHNTGLGLAIVKALTEQMGHRVSAAAEDGRFSLTIRWNAARD